MGQYRYRLCLLGMQEATRNRFFRIFVKKSNFIKSGACFLRSRFCVGRKVSYGRFERGTGLRAKTARLFCALMHTWCALPPLYGLLDALDLMRAEHAVVIPVLCLLGTSIAVYRHRTCAPAWRTQRSIG